MLNTYKKTNKNDQLLSWLQQKYVTNNLSAIISFLRENKILISLLTESYRELRKYFSSEDLRLELVLDPEIDEQQLFVYIVTSLSVTDALERLDRFDNRWWLDRIDRANGLLNFNLRFI